jgi:hypothetical protein
MSNLREISVAECKAVFGGNGDSEEPVITVTGRKLYYDSVMVWDFGQVNGYGPDSFGAAGGGGGFGNSPLPEGWDLGWVDTNNDGVPDSPPIIVTGPERLPDQWSEFSTSDKFQWVTAFLFSGGTEWYADYVAGTNLSGSNPDDPYTTPEQELGHMADVFEAALDPLSDMR